MLPAGQFHANPSIIILSETVGRPKWLNFNTKCDSFSMLRYKEKTRSCQVIHVAAEKRSLQDAGGLDPCTNIQYLLSVYILNKFNRLEVLIQLKTLTCNRDQTKFRGCCFVEILWQDRLCDRHICYCGFIRQHMFSLSLFNTSLFIDDMLQMGSESLFRHSV